MPSFRIAVTLVRNADPTRANKSTSDADEFGSTAKSMTLADIAVDSAASFRWDELKVGSMIDCLDTDMRWRRAQVTAITRSSYDVNDVFVCVHYLGWSEKVRRKPSYMLH